MEVGKKNEELSDSLKKSEYPYILPIWGAKATKRGFNLPYSAGLSMQYIWQKSDLIIDNLQVGFNNGPLINLDEVVRFNNATSNAQGLNVQTGYLGISLFECVWDLGKVQTINNRSTLAFMFRIRPATGTTLQTLKRRRILKRQQ